MIEIIGYTWIKHRKKPHTQFQAGQRWVYLRIRSDGQAVMPL